MVTAIEGMWSENLFEWLVIPTGFEHEHPKTQDRDASQIASEKPMGFLNPIGEVDGFESYYAGHMSFLLEIRW